MRRAEARERIDGLLGAADDAVRSGDPERAREACEQALALAREAGIEEEVQPLVEVRQAELDRLHGRGSPPPGAPAH